MALVTVSGAHLHPQALEDQTPTVSAAPHFPPTLCKSTMRAEARARRDAIDPAGAAEALARHLLGYIGDRLPPVVAGYWPIGGEIDPRPAMACLRDAGAKIALPESVPRSALRFRLWDDGGCLLPGRFGTRHAAGPEIVPDLVLVPLLAFDRRGHRLGYGGGYYDRTLAALPAACAIGCAFAAQQLVAIPDEPNDVALHAIVTELGVITCLKAADAHPVSG